MKHGKPIVIDGRQLCGETGGVQRFIREILQELDQISPPDKYEILVPPDAENLPAYKNLAIRRYGALKGLVWEQICLPWYLLTRRRFGVFPCTIVPMLYPHGLAILHDVMIAKLPELRESIESPFARWMLLLNYRIAAKRASVLATVSEFSKQDIAELYHVPKDRIYVIGNAWQHIRRVGTDESWREAYPQLKDGEYYFSLSANRKQKNFKWILETAKRNPDRYFAIAGCQEEWQKNVEFDAPNILHLGYISDEMIRSLIEHCRAFLFPSFYEGFGIPPMEALALGAKIVIARASCLPELYRDSAYYVDPFDYNVDLDKLLVQEVEPASKVLERFGWDISARKMDRICTEMAGIQE